MADATLHGRLGPARTRRLAWTLGLLAPALQLGGYVIYLGNAIGWIFLGVAVSSGLGGLAHGYAAFRLEDGGTADVVTATAAVYAEVSWVPFVLVPPSFLFLLFPDGHLPSRRWRPVAWAAAAGVAGMLVTSFVTPGALADFPQLRNPYGVDGPLLEPIFIAVNFLMLGAVIACVRSVIVRFRGGQREQRQQIKWLAVAGSVAAPTLAVNLLFYEDVANCTIMLAVLGLPAAAGIAILRHRLYDIDVVINRTLVYGALTATLAGAYLSSVLLLQLLLGPITQRSDLAIAGSTLAVAGLFRPARGRIQAAVDRRFYRSRYDAARTLEHFGVRLRDEVAIDALSEDLRALVADTMQPAHVSLWLRDTEPSRP